MRNSSKLGRVSLGLLLGAALAQGQTYNNAFPGLSFTRPIWMGVLPGGKPDHLLVAEQIGQAHIVRKSGATWVKSEFLKVTVSGGTAGGDERGLLGFAFHPDYSTNRKYYIYYFLENNGQFNIVEERLADATLMKDAGKSKEILRNVDYAGNHNGGTMAFGADGFLYIGTGDGGGQGDPNKNGQNKNSLFAKMLRIDVNKQENGKQYGIPSDNPFASGGGAGEIYAYGLRNPWKWSFDPLTKDLWVGDVGGGYQEEVNIIQKGGNYGWVVSEGDQGLTAGIKPPIFTFGSGCITGGYVFRGNPSSKFYGQFLVGDHGSSRMWALKSNGPEAKATTTTLANAPTAPRSFGVDAYGKLHVMGPATTIYKLDGADWEVTTANYLPKDGHLKQAIGCIFSCRPGSRIDAKAFAAGGDLEVLSLSGERRGAVSMASGEVPAGLKAGMYILKPRGNAKPNLLMIK